MRVEGLGLFLIPWLKVISMAINSIKDGLKHDWSSLLQSRLVSSLDFGSALNQDLSGSGSDWCCDHTHRSEAIECLVDSDSILSSVRATPYQSIGSWWQTFERNEWTELTSSKSMSCSRPKKHRGTHSKESERSQSPFRCYSALHRLPSLCLSVSLAEVLVGSWKSLCLDQSMRSSCSVTDSCCSDWHWRSLTRSMTSVEELKRSLGLNDEVLLPWWLVVP